MVKNDLHGWTSPYHSMESATDISIL
uniref:Uncharacterized protein n=1 Tax=Arundo donax TaxID=35708 RepID=A0A0A9BC80_ARUDO